MDSVEAPVVGTERQATRILINIEGAGFGYQTNFVQHFQSPHLLLVIMSYSLLPLAFPCFLSFAALVFAITLRSQVTPSLRVDFLPLHSFSGQSIRGSTQAKIS